MSDYIKLFFILLFISCKPESGERVKDTHKSLEMKINGAIPKSIKQEFLCETKNGEEAFLEIKADSTLYLETKTGNFNGYTLRKKDKLSIVMPSMSFSEELLDYSTLSNILLYFKTKNILCLAISHDYGKKWDRFIECLNARETPNNVTEKNSFVLYYSGRVDRMTWNNSESTKSIGVYLSKGNKLFMAFPKSNNDYFLNGRLRGDTVRIEQYKGKSGYCSIR